MYTDQNSDQNSIFRGEAVSGAAKSVPLIVGCLMASATLLQPGAARALDNVTLITDFGFNGRHAYGNGIVAADATIAGKPDLVRRFVAATVRGMKDAFADPSAAGEIMHRIVPQVDAAIARDETVAVAELAQIPGKPLGEIDPARIDATLDVVRGAFRLTTPVTAADLHAPGFVPR
jgi:ABC-type nitrate/sulfonate/bicarbonate transport system substrate-binding protein